MKDLKPGELFNKFQSKKKKAIAKPMAVKTPKFVPTYGGKVGGKMSNGAGWGGDMKSMKLKKGKKKNNKKHKFSKKNDHDADDMKKKSMCKEHGKSMTKAHKKMYHK